MDEAEELTDGNRRVRARPMAAGRVLLLIPVRKGGPQVISRRGIGHRTHVVCLRLQPAPRAPGCGRANRWNLRLKRLVTSITRELEILYTLNSHSLV